MTLSLKTCHWKAAFTRCKLARASEVPGTRAQTFRASRIMEVATRFRVQPVELSMTRMKRLHAYHRNLTRASQLASCKRGLKLRSNSNTCPEYFIEEKLGKSCTPHLGMPFIARSTSFVTEQMQHSPALVLPDFHLCYLETERE
jgi:hypothetical protein